MTVLINDTDALVSYTATAGQTVFAVPFEFFAVTDLVVESNGVALVYDAGPPAAGQFSVTGANVEGGGSITLGSPAMLGDSILIYRNLPFDRRANYPETGPFAVRALNTEQARQIAMMQQLRSETGRAVKSPRGEDGPTLRPGAELDGRLLMVVDDEVVGADIPSNPAPVKTISATSYTLLPEDANHVLVFTAATLVTVFVKVGSLVEGAGVEMWQRGAGQILPSALSGVSLALPPGVTRSRGLNSVIALRKLAGEEIYGVAGDLSA